MNEIFKGKVRILRPIEVKTLLKGIPKYQHQLLFKVLLYTGARYIEIQRLKHYPHWFDGDFIKLPSLKNQSRQKERWIRLNQIGKEIINAYLYFDFSLPSKISWRENLRRWARNVNLAPDGLCPKTTRKTWESWLTFYYGSKLEIPLSQGHSENVAYIHYLNLPFTEIDKVGMKEFVEGWI